MFGLSAIWLSCFILRAQHYYTIRFTGKYVHTLVRHQLAFYNMWKSLEIFISMLALIVYRKVFCFVRLFCYCVSWSIECSQSSLYIKQKFYYWYLVFLRYFSPHIEIEHNSELISGLINIRPTMRLFSTSS